MSRTKSHRTIPQRSRKRQPPTYPDVSVLNDERRDLGITLDVVAAEAAKTARKGTCGRTTVSQVFLGYSKSWNVLRAYERVKKARQVSRNGAGAAA